MGPEHCESMDDGWFVGCANPLRTVSIGNVVVKKVSGVELNSVVDKIGKGD